MSVPKFRNHPTVMAEGTITFRIGRLGDRRTMGKVIILFCKALSAKVVFATKRHKKHKSLPSSSTSALNVIDCMTLDFAWFVKQDSFALEISYVVAVVLRI